MEKANLFLASTVTLLVILSGVLGMTYGSSLSLASGVSELAESGRDANTIVVSGVGEAGIQPDRVKITFNIQTEAETAQLAAERNAEIFSAVKEKILARGLQEKDIESQGFTLQPVYDYKREGPPKIIGYRASHRVTVTVTNEDLSMIGQEAGAVIDIAVSAGVNIVEGVQFTVSDSALSALRNEALRKAVLNAQAKAEEMTEALQVKILGIKTVTEASFGIPIPRPTQPFGIAEAKAATEFIPGEVQISASVTVTYIIGS